MNFSIFVYIICEKEQHVAFTFLMMMIMMFLATWVIAGMLEFATAGEIFCRSARRCGQGFPQTADGDDDDGDDDDDDENDDDDLT